MLRARSLLAVALLISGAAAFAACETLDFRRGNAGESCSRTDDCASPLVCIDLTCVDPGGTTTTNTIITGNGGGGTAGGGTTSSIGTGGTTSSGGTGGSTASGGTTSSGGTGGTTSSGGTGGSGGGQILDTALCDQCLHDQCGTPLSACTGDCLELESCIETLCSHLSAIASPDEGQCQVHCQQLHLASKTKHLNVVNCTLGASCPPCSSYPWDYEICKTDATAAGGECSTQYDACNASPDCVSTRDCLSTCGTLSACLACENSPTGVAGMPLLSEYELCISTKCIALSWIL